ncbi:hypothetical protein I3843_12G083100 [Carya illinoinensis]|nr:hypothetical protein I3843_12G083100 [Carya illinoinensis]
MSDSENPKHDRTADKKVRPLRESVGIDSRFKYGFINKKLISREVDGIRKDKEPKTNIGIGELSLDVSSCGTSSSSGGSSDDGEKTIAVPVSSGVGGGEERRSFARPLLSSTSVIGRRRVMEDAVRVAPRFAAPGQYCDTYDFFAVYDGHNGDRVAKACRDRLHVILEEEVERWWSTGGGRGVDWEKAMVACFTKMDEEVKGGGTDEGEARMVGSTAVVVLVGKEEVVVANCGDSRAVLCRDGVAVPLSLDHKPDRPDERERVEAAGGRVIEWNGSRVLGVLATSRSIGDHYLRPYVISEPEVTVTERTESDEFIVIASDGLWDVISNELACEVGRICLNNGRVKRKFPYHDLKGNCAVDTAAVLAEIAMARGSKDNISVIVVQLRKSR